MLGCLESGVTLTFLGPEGEARGFGLPTTDPAHRDSQRIEEFLSRADWEQRYRDWLRSYERREVLYVLKQMRIQASDLRPGVVVAGVENHLAGKAPLALCRRAKKMFDGLLASRVSESAMRAALAPEILVNRRPGFHFLRDWSGMLSWRLWADLDRFLGDFLQQRLEHSALGLQDAIRAAYEGLHEREDRRIARYLDEFQFWLGGLEEHIRRRGGRRRWPERL